MSSSADFSSTCCPNDSSAFATTGCWRAEMGRTPAINAMRGRDHWGTCWSVTLSGCGIKGGTVYGSTNAGGTDVATNKVSAAEFFATIFAALGIDHRKEYAAPDGRPLGLTPYNTRSIADILA